MKWRIMAFLSMLLASARHATASSCRQSRARIRRLSPGFLPAASSSAAGARGRHTHVLLPRLLGPHAPWPSSLHSSTTTIGAIQRTLVSMTAAAGRTTGSKKSAKPVVVVPGRYRGVALEDLQAPAEIKQELRDLARELEAHDNLYYNKDEPQIADAEYDGLAQRLEALERGHLALVQELQAEEGYVSRADRVGAAPSAAAVTVGGAGVEVGARFAPVTHGWPMMSLDNAFSGEDVEAWAVRLEKVLKEEGEEVVVPKEEERAAVTAARPLDFVAEVKIDGVSLSLRYEDGVLVRGATRGNGFVGEDVTANVQAIASIPKRLPSSCFLPPTVMEVRGEVYISRQVFEELNEARAAQGAPLLSNPRNAASGSLRQLNPSLTRERRLGFFAYAAETDTPFSTSSLPSSFSFPTTQGAILTRLEQWGFEVAKPWARCQGTEDLQQFHRRLEGERASLGFDVDGVVYKLDDLPSRATAGRSARAPRWALAHKFSPVEAQTRVRSVEVQVGRTGILTPVALLEPVTVGGVVISRATLHNFQDLARRDVRVGDIVAVRRAGDVIPQVLGRANVTAIEERRPEPVVPPSVCPSCGGPVRVEEDMVGIYCPAGLSCPAQSLERLAHFASRDAFDIKGLGGRRVEELVGWGLLPSGPVDLFHLEEREEAKRKKMKEKIAAAAAGEGGRDGEEEGEKEGVWLLEEREGWGIKSVTALFSAIAARRSVPLSRFIFGLGVTHVGLTTAQAIARHFGSAANWWRAMQELEKEVEVEEEEEEEEDLEEEEVLDEEEADNGDDDDRTAKKKKKAAAKNKPKKKNAVKPNENAGGLETIEGIGPTVIGSLRAFVRDERNRRTVEALMQEVQVTSEGGQGQGDATEGGEAGGMVVPTEGPLVGKTVLFTGTLDSMTRSEAEARARQLGAKPVKTLSKKVDMVVVGVDPGGKVRKARDLGVGLVDEAEWQALVAKASDS